MQAYTYKAIYTGYARISTLYNNGNTNYTISTNVSLHQYTNDQTGTSVLNNSPVSNTLPIIMTYANQVFLIFIISLFLLILLFLLFQS